MWDNAKGVVVAARKIRAAVASILGGAGADPWFWCPRCGDEFPGAVAALQGRVLGLSAENDSLRAELAKLKGAPKSTALDRLAAAVGAYREAWRRYSDGEGGASTSINAANIEIAEARMFRVLDEVAPKFGRKGPRPGLTLVGGEG